MRMYNISLFEVSFFAEIALHAISLSRRAAFALRFYYIRFNFILLVSEKNVFLVDTLCSPIPFRN